MRRAARRGALALALLATPALAQEEGAFLGTDFAELTGEAEFEGTLFLDEPRFDAQDRNGASFALKPRFVAEWGDGIAGAPTTVTLAPFVRVDANDSERTHADAREAKVDLRFGDTDVTVGADIVYWGRAETDQIVDIVNQTDQVEGTDGEDKLGQPMVAVRRLVNVGEFSGQAALIWMPYFRERTFLGEESRLRTGLAVKADDVRYGTGAEEWTQSFAARLSGFMGDVDAGVHVFHGLSRDPAFEVRTDRRGRPILTGGRPLSRTEQARSRECRRIERAGNPLPTDCSALFAARGAPELRPVYDRVTQVGIDGQYTAGATLWKLEAIHRWDQLNLDVEKEDYGAVVAGLEHTLYGIADSNADLGLIAEGLWDSRDEDALTPFEHDVTLGMRLALNDTQDTSALLTGTVDLDNAETLLRFEAERRIAPNATIDLEAGLFLNTDAQGFAADLRDDDYLRATVSVFW